MNIRAMLVILIILNTPASAQEKPERFYATGLVAVSEEDANQVVLLVPEWEVLLTAMAFKKPIPDELEEDDYQTILVEKGEKAEALRALEDKVVAVIGVVGEGGTEDEPHMKVLEFVEAHHDAAKALLTVKK